MEILILWVACAIICAIVANLKGRSVVGWFFLGLLFGLLAVIIILCLSSNRTSMTDVLAAQKLIEMANERPGSVDGTVLARAQRTLSSDR
jgi:uncharacterized membrane protein YeiB